MNIHRNNRSGGGGGKIPNVEAANRETSVNPDAMGAEIAAATESTTPEAVQPDADAPAAEAAAPPATDDPPAEGDAPAPGLTAVPTQLQRETAGTIPPPYSLADVRNLIATGVVDEDQWHRWGYDERKDALAAFKAGAGPFGKEE